MNHVAEARFIKSIRIGIKSQMLIRAKNTIGLRNHINRLKVGADKTGPTKVGARVKVAI